MAERVTQLRDSGDRVMGERSGRPGPGVPEPEERSVRGAEDRAPAGTAGLDRKLVVGVATALGGPAGHAAIIARQLGIPCVVAVAGLDDVPAGMMVLVDGTRGTVTVTPDEAAAREAVADADCVFEAAPEKPVLKQVIFADVEAAARPDCLFCSNTSVIPITTIMGGLAGKGRALGTHWWNPPPMIPLVVRRCARRRSPNAGLNR